MKFFVPEERGLGVRLRATARYLPERVLDNAEVVARGAPLSAEEIEKLSGIRERRHASPEEATSDLALAAARAVLERADVAPDAVERTRARGPGLRPRAPPGRRSPSAPSRCPRCDLPER